MTRSTFRARLQEVGLTAEEFAEIVRVDPKTVQRWVAGRVPQRRHRAKIARALDTPQDVLWPDDTPASVPAPEASENARRLGGDVVASWGWADDQTAPDPVEFVTSGEGPIEVLDGRGELLRDDRLIAALLEAVGERSPVRVLVDCPRRELVPLIGVEHLELRVIDSAGPCAIVRVGDRMLVLIDLPRVDVDELRPLLELRHCDDTGLFARMTLTFDGLWDAADETVRSDEQLDEYLTDSPGIREYVGVGSDDELFPADGPTVIGPSGEPATDRDTVDPRTSAPGSGPRRWPRRAGDT